MLGPILCSNRVTDSELWILFAYNRGIRFFFVNSELQGTIATGIELIGCRISGLLRVRKKKTSTIVAHGKPKGTKKCRQVKRNLSFISRSSALQPKLFVLFGPAFHTV